MKDKKIKRINVRISLQDYELLKEHYNWTKKWMKSRHKSFSDYVRYLLEVGSDNYY
jgi:hypothetical protein